MNYAEPIIEPMPNVLSLLANYLEQFNGVPSMARNARYVEPLPPEQIVFEHAQVFVVHIKADELADEFQIQASEWKRDTLAMSSLSDMFTHPAYQRIMAMGKPALRLILEDLRKETEHWFYALEFIVGKEGKDVAQGAETVDDAKSAWLEWGYKNGYL
jgi:hypothetical protein